MEEKLLNLPEDYPKQDFKKNLIKIAVCELRFPVILDLETNPPAKLHSAIRKEYPHYEKRASINLQFGTESKEIVYVFLSKNKEWTLSVKPSSISLETKKYNNFTEFMKRLNKILASSKKFIDSNFFTRVGLRYIDSVPVNEDPIEEWINSDLVKPLTSGTYGSPDLYWQTISSNCNSGKFTFQHGIKDSNVFEYILDFDFFDENIENDDVNDLLKNLHHESLKLFFWSIGKKSIDYMSK